MTLPGNRSAVAASGGATYGPSPRRSTSTCSASELVDEHGEPVRVPLPDICATT